MCRTEPGSFPLARHRVWLNALLFRMLQAPWIGSNEQRLAKLKDAAISERFFIESPFCWQQFK